MPDIVAGVISGCEKSAGLTEFIKVAEQQFQETRCQKCGADAWYAEVFGEDLVSGLPPLTEFDQYAQKVKCRACGHVGVRCFVTYSGSFDLGIRPQLSLLR